MNSTGEEKTDMMPEGESENELTELEGVQVENNVKKIFKPEEHREENLELITYQSYLDSITPDVKEYHDSRMKLNILSIVFKYILLGILVFSNAGAYFVKTLNLSTTFSIPSVMTITSILVVITTLLGGIFSFQSERIEREHGFSTLTNKKWFKRQIIGFLLNLVISNIVFVAIYYFLSVSEYWWFYTFIAYFIFFSLLQFILPVFIVPLFFKMESFPEGELRSRLEKLADGMGIKYKDIYLMRLSDATNKVNAAVMGFGSSLRIVIGDTLVQKFRDDEIEIVMCHEIGHQKSKDVYRYTVFIGLIILVLLLIINQIFDFVVDYFGYGTRANPATLVFFFSAFDLLSFLTNSLSLWYSRKREKAADITAIKYINNYPVYESAFTRLAKTGKSYPNPSKLEVFFFYSHPPISERVQYAKQYVETS